jgi:hypothetical protein
LEDARSLVPGATNIRSTETSDRFQQPPQQRAPLPSVSNIQSGQAPPTAPALNSDRLTLQANSEVDKRYSNPIADTPASHETAGPEGARQEAHQSSLPIATDEPARGPKLAREAKRNIAKQPELTPRPRETQSRGNDLSAFFQPWWYAYPRDWRRTGGERCLQSSSMRNYSGLGRFQCSVLL